MSAGVGSAVVSEDGSRAYFVSSANLVTDPDLTPDVQHIYVNDGSGVSFVANTGQLGQTATSFPRGQISPDGSVLWILAPEQLTDAPTNGNPALYRYEAEADELTCASCVEGLPYTYSVDFVANGYGGAPSRAASDNGDWAFFTSTAALVPDDTNQALDVYRWHEGDGVALITDGVSQVSGFSPNHGFGGTDVTGTNAVFSAFERLVPQHIGGPQIYTARIGGLFFTVPAAAQPGLLRRRLPGQCEPAARHDDSRQRDAGRPGQRDAVEAQGEQEAQEVQEGLRAQERPRQVPLRQAQAGGAPLQASRRTTEGRGP